MGAVRIRQPDLLPLALAGYAMILPFAWQVIVIPPTGPAFLGPEISLTETPMGEAVTATLYNAAMIPVDTVDGYFVPHSGLSGGQVLIPAPTDDAAYVAIEGLSSPIPLR